MQSAAGSTPNAEKADGGRHEIGGTMELYLRCQNGRLIWVFDVRFIVRFDRFAVQNESADLAAAGCDQPGHLQARRHANYPGRIESFDNPPPSSGNPISPRYTMPFAPVVHHQSGGLRNHATALSIHSY